MKLYELLSEQRVDDSDMFCNYGHRLDMKVACSGVYNNVSYEFTALDKLGTHQKNGGQALNPEPLPCSPS